MNLVKSILIAMLILMVSSVEAKPLKTNKVYMFGFSASFKDSVVYVTEIQNVQEAWIDTKTKFLLGRDQYSAQLKNYLTDKLNQPGRVSMVLFELNKKKAEKLYLKLMKKYQKGYDVRYVNNKDFSFEAIEMSPDDK